MNTRILFPEKSLDSEHGSAILEFAIILPLLFMLAFATIEFTRIFKVREFQALVTREAATIAFRHCFERGTRRCDAEGFVLDTPQVQRDRLEICLREYNDRIDSEIGANAILNGITLTISFYEVAGAGYNLLGTTTRANSNLVPTASKYPGNESLAIRRDFGPMLDSNEMIVIAESFIDFRFTLINVFFGEPTLELYHVTAY